MHPQTIKLVREYTDHLEHIERKVRDAIPHPETNLNERDALRQMADALNLARKEAARALLGPVDEGCC